MNYRYTVMRKSGRPQADYYESDVSYDKVHLPRLSAIEDDTPIDTGLVDKRGNSIYRVPHRGKVGF